jgi:hypothetical protein
MAPFTVPVRAADREAAAHLLERLDGPGGIAARLRPDDATKVLVNVAANSESKALDQVRVRAIGLYADVPYRSRLWIIG